MLEANLKTQLKAYLEKVSRPIEIVASLDNSPKSVELQGLLHEIATLSDRIAVIEKRDDAQRKPSFSIGEPGEPTGIRFAGIPMGHEFTSLVLALLQTGGHPVKLDDAVIEQIRALDGDYEFETYISLSCQNCPEVVQALNVMALINPRISQVTIDGALFQDEVDQRQIMAVPTVYMNGEVFGQGRTGVKEILVISQDTGAYGRDISYAESQFGDRRVRAKFIDLMRELGGLGLWVRLHYVYPYPHIDEVLPLMAAGTIFGFLILLYYWAKPYGIFFDAEWADWVAVPWGMLFILGCWRLAKIG